MEAIMVDDPPLCHGGTSMLLSQPEGEARNSAPLKGLTVRPVAVAVAVPPHQWGGRANGKRGWYQTAVLHTTPAHHTCFDVQHCADFLGWQCGHKRHMMCGAGWGCPVLLALLLPERGYTP